MFALISHAGCCVKVALYCSWLREQCPVSTLTSGDWVARGLTLGWHNPGVWWGHDGNWPLQTLILIANFHRALNIRSHSEAYPNGQTWAWVRPGAGLGHIMANIWSGNIRHPGRGFMQEVGGNKNQVDRVKLPCNCYSKQRPMSRHPSCSEVTTPGDTRHQRAGAGNWDDGSPPALGPTQKRFSIFMVIFLDAGPKHTVSQKNEKNVTFTLKQAKKFFKQQGRWVVCLRVRWIDGMIVG